MVLIVPQAPRCGNPPLALAVLYATDHHDGTAKPQQQDGAGQQRRSENKATMVSVFLFTGKVSGRWITETVGVNRFAPECERATDGHGSPRRSGRAGPAIFPLSPPPRTMMVMSRERASSAADQAAAVAVGR